MDMKKLIYIFCAASLLTACTDDVMDRYGDPFTPPNPDLGPVNKSKLVFWILLIVGVIGVIGSVIIGRIVFKLGIKKAGVMTAVLYVVALLCNISGIMPLVWISLVIIGFLGAAAPNLMNSIPGSVFGRVGYAKVNSVVFPITNIIFMCNFAVNGIVQGLFHSISAVYIVFAVLALISLFLILAIQDHKYDQDYMAAHKN